MEASNPNDFMAYALEEAKVAKAENELPFGAVVVKDGNVVGRGHCEEVRLHTVLAHAELSAINEACLNLKTNKLSDCTIYCTNEPCVMCAAAIFQAKVPRVVIGASRKDLSLLRDRDIDIETLAKDSGYEIQIANGVMRENVLRLFEN